LVASTETEKKKIQISQVNELLVDAVELAKENRPELVTQNLEQYTNQIAQISSEVDSLPDSEKADVIATVIEKGVESLTAIQELQTTNTELANTQAELNTASSLKTTAITNLSLDLDKQIEAVKLISEQSLESSLDIAKEVKNPETVEDIKKVSEAINIAESPVVISSPNLIVDTVSIPTALELEGGQKIEVTPSVVLPSTDTAQDSLVKDQTAVEPLLNPDGTPVQVSTETKTKTTTSTSDSFIQSALKFLN